jgi:hypothetical protein
MARQNNPQIKDMGRLVPGEKVLSPNSTGGPFDVAANGDAGL